MEPTTESNLFPEHARFLGRGAREKQLHQRAGVVWLYGLSGSGKSTLATALERKLYADGKLTAVLDGDIVRTGLNRGLGFSDDDRRENIRRVAEVARLFLETGLITIASFITPTKSLRNLARQIIGEEDFLEIYVKASFEACAQRDRKGLYARAEKGKLPQFTGKDSRFEEPDRADLVLNTEEESPEESLAKLVEFVRPRIGLGSDPQAR
ncbi:MAG: adenylyl-sulfate kinase [Verrucomicrobiales bacterium]|nr:adenylyl-sulfate kinase [Verrucomicrobiales bacterium]